MDAALNEKLVISNSSGVKSVFEKFRFRDGLYDGRSNHENKVTFVNPSSVVWTGPEGIKHGRGKIQQCGHVQLQQIIQQWENDFNKSDLFNLLARQRTKQKHEFDSRVQILLWISLGYFFN